MGALSLILIVNKVVKDFLCPGLFYSCSVLGGKMKVKVGV